MIDSPIIATLVVLAAWWLSTGLILWRVRVADNSGARAHKISVLAGLPLGILGLFSAFAARDMADVGGVYLSFAAALALWGWIELAFLSGVITGPSRSLCPPNARPMRRFWAAIGVIAWHEAALLLGLIALIYIGFGAENPFAAATFAVLFAARILAKLNLFLGVPRINVQFLPRPLAHLASYFRQGPFTIFFPVSVTILTVTSALLLERAIGVSTPQMALGYTMLTALCLLALLEHWFMVLPIPDEKLWRWMLPASKLDIQRLEDDNGL
jgi:putative photosynthetic complex assembly protein 2